MISENIIGLDIDKYVLRYKELCREFYAPVKKCDRYYVASWYLFKRSVENSNNIFSSQLSELFKQKGDEIKAEYEIVYSQIGCKQKAELSEKGKLPFLFFPNEVEWLHFEEMRYSYLKQDKENLAIKYKGSALPLIEFYKLQLANLLQVREIRFLDFYLNGQIFVESERVLLWFAFDVSLIDFAKHIQDEIRKNVFESDLFGNANENDVKVINPKDEHSARPSIRAVIFYLKYVQKCHKEPIVYNAETAREMAKKYGFSIKAFQGYMYKLTENDYKELKKESSANIKALKEAIGLLSELRNSKAADTARVDLSKWLY